MWVLKYWEMSENKVKLFVKKNEIPWIGSLLSIFETRIIWYFKEKNALVDQLGALEEPTIINGWKWKSFKCY